MNRLNLILRQKVFSIIFILIAVLGGVFIYWYISNLKSKIPEDMQYQEVFIAKNDIKKGEKISKDLLEKQKLPECIFSEKFILNEDQILGKEATSDILKGEIIYVDEIEGANLSYNYDLRFSSYIPKNLRAVSAPVNYFGDGLLLRVGDRVDIISTYYDQTDGELKSSTILSEKEIILVENNFENSSYDSIKDDDFLSVTMLEEDSDSSSLSNFLVITFYLEPQEVEKIFLALERGVLNLSICSQSKDAGY